MQANPRTRAQVFFEDYVRARVRAQERFCVDSWLRALNTRAPEPEKALARLGPLPHMPARLFWVQSSGFGPLPVVHTKGQSKLGLTPLLLSETRTRRVPRVSSCTERLCLTTLS
jgi:hypothetical protein